MAAAMDLIGTIDDDDFVPIEESDESENEEDVSSSAIIYTAYYDTLFVPFKRSVMIILFIISGLLQHVHVPLHSRFVSLPPVTPFTIYHRSRVRNQEERRKRRARGYLHLS